MGCLLLSLLFIGLPMAEIMVIKAVAARIGGLDTFFLLVFSVVLGTYLAKHQGTVVLGRVQQCLAEGRMPTLEMVDGLLVFLGGILFVFPGFISDGLGLLLLFPLTRWLVRWVVLAGLQAKNSAPVGGRQRSSTSTSKGAVGQGRPGVVDAEVIE